jgi:phosphoribosylamine--glycine ligase
MKLLIIGSGAREHALAKALHRSPQQPTIYCCGTTQHPAINRLAAAYWVGDITDIQQVLAQAIRWSVDMVVIGPEAPLEQGLADVLWQHHIPTIGPKQVLAQIETSKTFTRDLLAPYEHVGAVAYRSFNALAGVMDYLQQLGEDQYVIKANGLMGGKGVKVGGEHLHSFDEAYQFCASLVAAGQAFVIEEKVVGQEFSLMCFCDGTHLVPMPIVQDHKRAYVDDLGPNTGGMGSYSMVNHRLPFLTDDDLAMAHHINECAIKALRAVYPEPYIGFLYGSFMATKQGVKLIEFNARLGDPEALNVLAILHSDLLAIFQAMVQGCLSSDLVVFEAAATVCKYAVPDGYPDHPEVGGLIDVSAVQKTEQLYLASVYAEHDQLYAAGSRAVAVVGVSQDIGLAEAMAEADISRVTGALFHRPDIGTKASINRRIAHMNAIRQKDTPLL